MHQEAVKRILQYSKIPLPANKRSEQFYLRRYRLKTLWLEASKTVK